jgi:hypothetical protein
MSDCDPSCDLTVPPKRKATWPLYSAAAALVLIGWLIAQYSRVQKAASIDEISFAYNLMTAGALPWLLQWGGVTCAILTRFGSRNTRNAGFFAVMGSLTLAAIWWFGVAFKYRAMDPLEVVLDQVSFAVESHFGTSTFLDTTLFHFIGPIMGPFRLRGPINLHEWNFLFAVLSTSLMVGYLLFIGRFLQTGKRSSTASDYVKFIGALLPVFLPPFIRLGLRIAQTVT